MARPGVTYTEVVNAITQLIAQQQTPTIERIRGITGAGSSTTLANHFKQWKATHEAGDAIAAKENIPSELVSLIKGLWVRVVSLSEEKIALADKDFQASLAEANQTVEKYKANNQRWQKMHESWIAEKNKLAELHLTTEQALGFAQTENNSLSQQNDSLIKQIEHKDTRIEELHRLHNQTQANLEHFRETTREQKILEQEAHSNALQKAESAIQVLRQELALSQKELAHTQFKLAAELATITNLKDTLTNAHDLNSRIEDQCHQLTKELHENKAHQSNLCKNYESLKSQHIQRDQELVMLQKENGGLSQKIMDISDQMNDLKLQNNLLIAEKWEMAQEKSQLQGQLNQLVGA
jgi:chromosome segregation ATPase